MNEEPVGITVSEFYTYSIELEYYHWGKPLTFGVHPDSKEAENEKMHDFLSKGVWRRNYDSTDVLNITKGNISDIAKLLTGKIIETNDELFRVVGRAVKESNSKYTPTCHIIFTDVESLTPLIENTVIGKLIKSFRVRVKVYDALDENYYVNFGKLQAMVEWAIKEQLLDVVDQIKEEETYTPKVDLSGILPPIMKQV
jgi:hypothetical protein